MTLDREEFPRSATDLARPKSAFAAPRDTSIPPDGATFGQGAGDELPALGLVFSVMGPINFAYGMLIVIASYARACRTGRVRGCAPRCLPTPKDA